MCRPVSREQSGGQKLWEFYRSLSHKQYLTTGTSLSVPEPSGFETLRLRIAQPMAAAAGVLRYAIFWKTKTSGRTGSLAPRRLGGVRGLHHPTSAFIFFVYGSITKCKYHCAGGCFS